ncbi:PREDICTED: uncharacterized protein LOC106807919 [Priapulus caudatus]|uniref:Uncharacterized protein LOC106807919 n=1 Tax=Priapulus caudatus TaxID=37621 RepID=A0ABM1E147_PRICU|nr:PREDICTED: uncharacterized protein LOC106807919 [Priapulus caudatus]
MSQILLAKEGTETKPIYERKNSLPEKSVQKEGSALEHRQKRKDSVPRKLVNKEGRPEIETRYKRKDSVPEKLMNKGGSAREHRQKRIASMPQKLVKKEGSAAEPMQERKDAMPQKLVNKEGSALEHRQERIDSMPQTLMKKEGSALEVRQKRKDSVPRKLANKEGWPEIETRYKRKDSVPEKLINQDEFERRQQGIDSTPQKLVKKEGWSEIETRYKRIDSMSQKLVNKEGSALEHRQEHIDSMSQKLMNKEWSDREPSQLSSTHKADQQRLKEELYAGHNLGCLPAVSSNIVRVFLSSTFTDTQVERNALMETVYPRLKQYCRETHGLEFQVIDMRWGIRDEATDDHMTTEICMKAIQTCRQLSLGPNFVVLLGHKYGYRPLPRTIPADKFEVMRAALVEQQRYDVKLLDTWYKLDTNAAPPVYVLQTISSIIPSFSHKRQQAAQLAAQRSWWDVSQKLQTMLRRAAHACFSKYGMSGEGEKEKEQKEKAKKVTDEGALETNVTEDGAQGRKGTEDGVQRRKGTEDGVQGRKVREDVTEEATTKYIPVGEARRKKIKRKETGEEPRERKVQQKDAAEQEATEAGVTGKETPKETTEEKEEAAREAVAEEEETPEELAALCSLFRELLSRATRRRPLVIFLDALDQLSAADGAHALGWIPVSLPAHVRIVLTVGERDVLDALRYHIDDDDGDGGGAPRNFLEVRELGAELAMRLLQTWLHLQERKITNEQAARVEAVFGGCSTPLCAKLVFDTVRRWTSYASPSALQTNTGESIMAFFDRIELQHGKVLVQHALSYITASRSGLSEAELEDLLSLDDEVLNDVYQYHLPPMRRIPPSLWTRIHNDMADYLSAREADGTTVFAWYHRQFMEAARARYFRNVNRVRQAHCTMAEYFLGTWGGGRAKPFRYSDAQLQQFALEKRSDAADRIVPAQPLFYTRADGTVSGYNMRKLNELPYHLVRSQQFDELYENCLFCFQWLHSKLSCCPLQAVLADFDDTYTFIKVRFYVDDELQLVVDPTTNFFDYGGWNGKGLDNPWQGRAKMAPFDQPFYIVMNVAVGGVNGYFNDAWTNSPHRKPWSNGSGQAFKDFYDQINVVSGLALVVWDMLSGAVWQVVKPGVMGILQQVALSGSEKHAATYSNYSVLVVCNILTGEFCTSAVSDDADPVRGIAFHNDDILLWTSRVWMFYSIEGRLLSRHEIPACRELEYVDYVSSEEHHLVTRAGEHREMQLVTHRGDAVEKPFLFHSAMVMDRARTTLFCCVAEQRFTVCRFRSRGDGGGGWRQTGSLDNDERVFSMTVSADDRYLLVAILSGYRAWNQHTGDALRLLTPEGVANIPPRGLNRAVVVVTRNNQYACAAVRSALYVWELRAGELLRTIDVHYARVLRLVAMTTHGVNKVATASLDRTVKLINVENIAHQSYPIDRLRRPVEAVVVAMATAFTRTRGCVAAWDLSTGRVRVRLADGGVVTHVATTSDARYVVAVQTERLLVWDARRSHRLKCRVPTADVLQLLLVESSVILLLQGAPGDDDSVSPGVCCGLEIPRGRALFRFHYAYAAHRQGALTADGLFVVLLTSRPSGGAIARQLSVWHTATGEFIYGAKTRLQLRACSLVTTLPHRSCQVALVFPDECCVWDVAHRRALQSIPRWDGVCTSDGRWGLHAPSSGGLELLNLNTGTTELTLLRRSAEGVHRTRALFSTNDRHIVYYNSGTQNIRVFRVADGTMIADYKLHTIVTAMVAAPDGYSIVLGAADGSLTTLTIADPAYKDSVQHLKCLKSRTYVPDSSAI